MDALSPSAATARNVRGDRRRTWRRPGLTAVIGNVVSISQHGGMSRDSVKGFRSHALLHGLSLATRQSEQLYRLGEALEHMDPARIELEARPDGQVARGAGYEHLAPARD